MNITLMRHAERFVGVHEIIGSADHPLIVWWLSLCGLKDAPDEIAWCSAFVNGMAWELRLPRSKSAAARSWLTVGIGVSPSLAQAAWDIVVLKRGTGRQPGPEVTSGAPGHVGIFAGWQADHVLVLGGNQSNAVSVASFPAANILGIRRLREE